MDLISLLRQQAAEQEAAERKAAEQEAADEATEPGTAEAAPSAARPAAGLLGDDGGAGPDPLADVDDVPPGQPG
nr:hypothetical protein GCM10010200_091970 [Actinomadura rugatobispora]